MFFLPLVFFIFFYLSITCLPVFVIHVTAGNNNVRKQRNAIKYIKFEGNRISICEINTGYLLLKFKYN